MGRMDQGVRQLMTIERFAARAAHQGIRLLRRHSFTTFPHGVFARRPVAGIAPSPVIGRRARGRKPLLVDFKIRARLIEGRRGATRLLAGLGAGIEAAAPFPWIFVMRLAYAARDRADPDVTEIDVPAVLAFGVSAADEFGHCPLKRGRPPVCNYQSLGDRLDVGLLDPAVQTALSFRHSRMPINKIENHPQRGICQDRNRWRLLKIGDCRFLRIAEMMLFVRNRHSID